MGVVLLCFVEAGFGSAGVREVWAVTDAVAGDVGRFGWAGCCVVCVIRLGLDWAFFRWGVTCEEHVFSGEAGKALLEVDGLGDRDSNITSTRHISRSRVSVKYRLEVGSEGDVFCRRGWGLQGCYEVVSDG